MAPTDQAVSSLRALYSYEHLRQIPSRLRVEAKLIEPNLSVHQFLQHLLRQIRLCSQCLGWPPSSEAILPGSDAIMMHASRPLPLSSVDPVWQEGEVCVNSAVRSRYAAYLDSEPTTAMDSFTSERCSATRPAETAKYPSRYHYRHLAHCRIGLRMVNRQRRTLAWTRPCSASTYKRLLIRASSSSRKSFP